MTELVLGWMVTGIKKGTVVVMDFSQERIWGGSLFGSQSHSSDPFKQTISDTSFPAHFTFCLIWNLDGFLLSGFPIHDSAFTPATHSLWKKGGASLSSIDRPLRWMFHAVPSSLFFCTFQRSTPELQYDASPHTCYLIQPPASRRSAGGRWRDSWCHSSW